MLKLIKRFKATTVTFKKKNEKLDPRYQLIKSMLYSPDEIDPVKVKTRYAKRKYNDSPIKGIEFTASLGDLVKSGITEVTFDINGPIPEYIKIKSVEDLQTDQLERQWYIHQHKQAQEFLQNQKTKYKKMREAMLQLEKLDKKLFDECNASDQEWVYFPKNFRIPTMTPPKKMAQ